MTHLNTHTLAVDGELTVYRVHALKDEWLAALATHAVLAIDLVDVSEVDGAGLQLLLSARHEARLRGGSLCIAGHSAVTREAVELAGLCMELGTDTAPAAENAS